MFEHRKLKSIYLATPYTHKSKKVMESRYLMANHACAVLMKEPYNYVVFSPITQTHEIAKYHEMPTTWDYWINIDFYFIDKMDELWVFMQRGYTVSVGVQAEIKYAKMLGKKIVYFKLKEDEDDVFIYKVEKGDQCITGSANGECDSDTYECIKDAVNNW